MNCIAEGAENILHLLADILFVMEIFPLRVPILVIHQLLKLSIHLILLVDELCDLIFRP